MFKRHKGYEEIGELGAGQEYLPPEMWVQILSHISVLSDQLRARQVCRGWNDILLHKIKDNNLMKTISYAEIRHKEEDEWAREKRMEKCYDGCCICLIGAISVLPSALCSLPLLLMKDEEESWDGEEHGKCIWCLTCIASPIYCIICCPCALIVGQYALWSTHWFSDD